MISFPGIPRAFLKDMFVGFLTGFQNLEKFFSARYFSDVVGELFLKLLLEDFLGILLVIISGFPQEFSHTFLPDIFGRFLQELLFLEIHLEFLAGFLPKVFHGMLPKYPTSFLPKFIPVFYSKVTPNNWAVYRRFFQDNSRRFL